jgi:hypothetical protein
MKFEERVGRRAVIRPVQRLKYLFLLLNRYRMKMCGRRCAHRDDVGVAHDCVSQGECKDDLEFERRHVSVHRDFLQRV